MEDGSFYVAVQAAPLSGTPGTQTIYVLHYGARGQIIDRARVSTPGQFDTNVYQTAPGPDGAFYAVGMPAHIPTTPAGKVDVVRLNFYPASQPLPPVPTALPTPKLPTPVPTADMLKVPSPMPSIAEQAPTAAPTPPGEPTTEVVDMPGAKGVSVRLIHQTQAATTGVDTGNCGTEMTWVLQIENEGTDPFLADIDKSSLAMTDSTGKSYPLSKACGSFPYSGSYAQPMTINSGDNLKGYIAFQGDDIPSSVHYLTLRFTISGMHVLLQYDLPR